MASPPQHNSIQSTKLCGHQGQVLCLDHSSSTNVLSFSGASTSIGCLLSGSEDATARLWDLRASPFRASLCIRASNEVTSVAFGPPLEYKGEVLSSFSRNYSVYLSVGDSICTYDLRQATSPIITEPSSSMEFLKASDEINQLALSQRRSAAERQHLAAADDSGVIQITDCLPGSHQQRKRILQHSTESALVTSIAFRPKCKKVELASGATDCTICLWDATKPRRPLSSMTITSTDSGANQVCNPPMVHSVAWSPSGRLLAAGLGDGSIAICSADTRSLNLLSRLEDAHGGAIASVLFPEWRTDAEVSNRRVSAHDRLLASTGNDGVIVLWDLGASLCGDAAIDPAAMLPLTRSQDAIDSVQVGLGQMELTSSIKSLFAWQHGSDKPNWMVSTRGHDAVFPSALFVADTSNEITVYSVPVQ